MNFRRGIAWAAPLLTGGFLLLAGPAVAVELGRPGTWDGSFGGGYAFPFGPNSENLRGSFAFDFSAEAQASSWTALGIDMGNDTSFVGRDGGDSLSIVSVTPTVKWGKAFSTGGGSRLRPYLSVGAGFYSLESVTYSTSTSGGNLPVGATLPVDEFGFNVGVGVDWQLGSNFLASLDARFQDLIFSHGGFEMATPSLKLSYIFGAPRRGSPRHHPIP